MNNHLQPRRRPRYYRLQELNYRIKGTVAVERSEEYGIRKNRRIWLNDIELFPEEAFNLRPFYECNFDWGKRAGLHSYTAALALCLRIFEHERIAENLFECFKAEFIDQLPSGNFEMTIQLKDFLKKYRSRLHPNLYSRFCYAALGDSREIMMFKNPRTGLITVNLAENYGIHHRLYTPEIEKSLCERKQRLVFRLFAKEQNLIKGYDFDTMMNEIEALISQFYWQSLERLLKKKIRPGRP